VTTTIPPSRRPPRDSRRISTMSGSGAAMRRRRSCWQRPWPECGRSADNRLPRSCDARTPMGDRDDNHLVNTLWRINRTLRNPTSRRDVSSAADRRLNSADHAQRSRRGYKAASCDRADRIDAGGAQQFRREEIATRTRSSGIRGRRIGSGPVGGTDRGEPAARTEVSFWCEAGHLTRPSCAETAVAPAVVCPPAWTATTRRSTCRPHRTKRIWSMSGSAAARLRRRCSRRRLWPGFGRRLTRRSRLVRHVPQQYVDSVVPNSGARPCTATSRACSGGKNAYRRQPGAARRPVSGPHGH